MAITIDGLQIEITQDSSKAVAGLDALASSLMRLRDIAKAGAGLTSVTNQLRRLGEALNNIQSPGTKIRELVSALRPLEYIGKNRLSSVVNSLKKLPIIADNLKAIDFNEFANQIQRVVNVLRPLGNEMNNIARGFNSFPSRIQRLIQQNEKLTTSNVNTAKSFETLNKGLTLTLAKLGGIYYLANMLSDAFSEWIKESNAYVENLNLFTVAMGKHSKEALAYALKVQEAMGIDPSEFIRNQGIFKQILTAFGVIEEKAYTMSRGLTQVSYDISSFFNIPIQQAFLKVQSGISGELEPLRRLGYALDIATLQHIAYANGINISINKMTQAQKSQLRYIAIMQQSRNVVGDMARTIITPANALRILNQQITQLKRALGDMLIPILLEMLPIVQAIVKFLTEVSRSIAKLLGFRLPKIDYSNIGMGISAGMDDANSSINDTAKSAKKLKSILAGFDELNILQNKEESSKDKGLGLGMGTDLPLDLSKFNYDFLGQLDQKINLIKEKIKSLLPLILGVGAGFATWKIGKELETFLLLASGGTLGRVATWLWDIGRALLGIAAGSQAAKSAFWFLVGGEAGLALGLLAVVVGIAVARFVDLYQNSETFRKGLQRLGELGKEVFEAIEKEIDKVGDAIGKLIPDSIKEKVSGALKKMGLDWKDLGITALGVALLFVPGGQIPGIILLGIEAISIAIRKLGSLSKKEWKDLKDNIIKAVGYIKDYLTDFAQFVSPVGLFLFTINLGIQNLRLVVSALGKWMSDFTQQKKKEITNSINTGLNYIYNLFTTKQSQISNTWNSLTNNISSMFERAKSSVISTVESMAETIRRKIESLKDWWSNLTLPSFKIKLPHLKWSVTPVKGSMGNLLETLGLPAELPKLSVNWYAEGGFPETGELFIAREAGAEMVGSIGNRTAVANNDQIVRAVSQGVYEAVKTAMGNGGNLNVTVKIGDDVIMERIIKNINRQAKISGKSVLVTT